MKVSLAVWYQRLKWYAVFWVVVAALCIGYRVYLKERIPDYVTLVSERNERQVIHDLTDQYVVEQHFSCDWDFDFITLEFSDHEQEMTGKTILEISDVAGNVVGYEEIGSDRIHYGSPVRLTFLNAEGGRAGETYTLRIMQQGAGETALGLYGYVAEAETDAAFANGEIQPWAVGIGIHVHTDMLHMLVRVMLLISVAGLCVTVYMSQTEKMTDEKLFLTVAIPFGICMLLFLCDNNVADYQAHYGKTYQCTNFFLGLSDRDTAGSTYMRLEDLNNGQDKNYFRDPAREAWVVLEDWTWFAQQDGMKGSSSFFAPASGGTLLAYLPNVLGMTLGRLLNLGTYPMVYLSRIFGFVTYLAICYWAIRKTPVLKTAFALTAALPVSLSNAAGITYDTMTISATLLMCAYIFLWWERDLKKTEWVALGMATIFVGACKGGVFLPVILLLLPVPKSRYHLTRRKILMAGCLMGAGFICFLTKYGGYLKSALRITASPEAFTGMYGSGYCFAYPLSFIKMMFLTVYEMGDKYIGQIIGQRLGWSGADTEWGIIISFLILLWTAAIRKEGEEVSIKGKRIYITFLLLAEFVGMHIVLMSMTSIGSETVWGVQGRYFVALLPLLLLICRENGLLREKRSGNKLYIGYSVTWLVYLFSYIDKTFGR